MLDPQGTTRARQARVGRKPQWTLEAERRGSTLEAGWVVEMYRSSSLGAALPQPHKRLGSQL